MKIRTLLLTLLIAAFFYQAQAQINLKAVHANWSQCDTSGWTVMKVKVANLGNVQLGIGTLINCTYKVGNFAPVVENFTTTALFSPWDTLEYQFTTPFHFNQFQTYNCTAVTHTNFDANTLDDTVHFTNTYWSLPGFGNHSSDTAVCQGSPATLWMELLGNGPWLLTFAGGTDTAFDLPVDVPLLSAEMTLDSTTTFTLIKLIDSNGCFINVNQGITITVGMPFTLNIGHDTTMCAGKTLLIDAGHAGAAFNWWDNTGGQVYSADTSDWSGMLGNQIVWVDVNDKGCIDRDSLSINWILCPDGLQENASDRVQMYPNPTTGNITIVFDNLTEQSMIRVENALGQVVYSKQTNAMLTSLDLRDQPDGLYIISLISKNSVVRKKVLLER